MIEDSVISQELYERTIRAYEKLIENGPKNRSFETKLETVRTRLQTEAESNQE
jgi:hypothetical protein